MTRKDGLPRRVYPKHGAYWYVAPTSGKWHRLCAIKDGLPSMLRALATLTDSEATSERMPAVITRWLAEKRKEWAEKTAKDQDRIAAELAQGFIEFDPQDVTTPVCAAYLKAYADTPRTYNLHRSMLSQVLKFAALEGLREGFNPLDNIPQKTLKGRRRVVTDAEVKAVRKAAMGATRNGEALVQMIDLALITGQRIGDLIGLRWQDVGKEGVSIQQGKTGERLLIGWTPALRSAIKACERGDRIGHVLKTQTGSGYRYAGIRSAWDRACVRAGIEDLHIHDLRGKAGVTAMGPDEDIRAAQKLLGHRGEAMTRHYVEGKYEKRVKPAK